MSESKMLSQAEIDALLRGSGTADEESSSFEPEEGAGPGTGETGGAAAIGDVLDDTEKDALGEIGNITMGSASTTLSELLHQKVLITSPRVSVTSQTSLFDSFTAPYIVIQVEFKSGLDGFNVLVIRLRDAMIIANLMMGGDGSVHSDEISEIELSAASEAMNQMIGTASTSLSTMFSRSINISPPVTTVLESSENSGFRLSMENDMVVVVSFDLKIGDLVDTEIMQVLSIETAKKEASMGGGGNFPQDEVAAESAEADTWLSKELWPGEGVTEEKPGPAPASDALMAPEKDSLSGARGVSAGGGLDAPPAAHKQTAAQGFSFPGLTPVEQKKLELLLEVPLKVSVILGRTKRPIKEVLNLTPGAIVELSSLVDEPVEVLVNGTLVARGEVVVVNENFGVRITNIISPEDRIKKLRE
ncbi:MAG: flagellar motor switch phosphatase FliY [Desulfocucumaceae bacterium]